MTKKSTFSEHDPCPCCSGVSYSGCCAVFHQGIQLAPNALTLMRSRYSAYVLKLNDYLINTWHPSTRPQTLQIDDEPIKWLKLIIIKAFASDQPNEAFVEFETRYRVQGKAQKMHEVSRFLQVDRQWLYVDGDVS